jgi:hypothetical protein
MREILVNVGAIEDVDFKTNITKVAIRIKQGQKPLNVSAADILLWCGLAYCSFEIGVSAKAEDAVVAGVWIQEHGNYTFS